MSGSQVMDVQYSVRYQIGSMAWYILYLVFISALSATQSNAARILGFFPAPSISHVIIHTSIIDALTDRSHDITVVTTTPIKNKDIKYRHIQIDLEGSTFPELVSKAVNDPQPMYKTFSAFVELVTTSANQTLNHPKFKRLMADESFDLVILGYFVNEFHLGVAAHFNCPVIISFMAQPMGMLNEMVGNPREVSYVPNIFAGARQPLRFFRRVKNLLFSVLFEDILFPLMSIRLQHKFYRENFPPDKYPPFDQVLRNVSLILTNHHFSQGPIRPNVPAMVEIGGIQIKEKPDPLPQDLKDILDNAKHGVIYFSFGSNVDGKLLDKTKAKILFNALSKVPQTILWKWGKSDVPGKSPNIHYKTWLPQDDILAHPNVVLFITHGGAGSVLESQYHGVPMVGIPLFAEQESNVGNMVRSGYGVKLDFPTLTESSLVAAIEEVLLNKKYKETIKQFAKIYMDRPMSPKQTAAYWVEYVLRHHGAPHMQSPAVHMNRFQILSLDVIAFLAVVLYLVYKVIKIICSFICCRGRTKEKKNKKE